MTGIGFHAQYQNKYTLQGHKLFNLTVFQQICFIFSASFAKGAALKGTALKVSVKNISHDVCLIPAQVFSQGFYGSVLCKSRSLTFYIPHAPSSHSSTGADNTGQIS